MLFWLCDAKYNAVAHGLLKKYLSRLHEAYLNGKVGIGCQSRPGSVCGIVPCFLKSIIIWAMGWADKTTHLPVVLLMAYTKRNCQMLCMGHIRL